MAVELAAARGTTATGCTRIMTTDPPPVAPSRHRILAGWLTSIVALAGLGLGGCATRNTLGERPPESARIFVEPLGRQVAFHLANNDLRAVTNLAASALARTEVRWVLIQDADGQTIAEVAEDAADAPAIRSEIVRRTWQPATESWSRLQMPGGGSAHNLSRPLSTTDLVNPGSAGASRLGTLHVGFGPPTFFASLDRLLARGRSITAGWTSPLRRNLTTRSRQALVYYRDGVRANRKYYESEARTAWQMALEEDPHFAMAMVRLGQLAHQLGDGEEAMSWYRRAQAEEARVSEKERLEIHRLGANLEDREDDERGIEAEMIRRFADDAEVLLVSGNQHLNEGRPEMALANLEKARRLDPELPEVWNLIGYAESDLGHWLEAEEAFEKYAFQFGDQANPHDSLGEFYLRTGRYRKALAQIESAIVIKPDFSWAYYHLALANAELGRWEAAIFAIQRARDASKNAPEDINWSRTEILLHLRAGRIVEATRLLAAHRTEFSLTSAGLALMTRVALAAGDLPLARAGLHDLQAAVQNPESLKRQDRAQASNYGLLLEMQGLVSRADGQPGAAVERLDAAMTVATSWEARLRIERESIEILVEAGRREEAIRRLEAILARNPDDPTANWWFGRALELDGSHEEARVAFERARRVLDGADLDDPLMVAVREACRVSGG